MGGKKSGGGFLGIGGQSGFLNTGLFSSGPQKISGFEMNPQSLQYENDAMKRMNDIASGKQSGYAQQAFNANMDATTRQAMAMAASQRGASNPMLAYRQAQISNQQAQLEGAQQAALMAAQERQQADQALMNQTNAQRGIAFNQSTANLHSKLQNQQLQTQGISAIGQGMASVALKAHGGLIEGEAKVPGDSHANDVVPALLSPGEIVVPRSVAENPKLVKAFIQKIKAEKELQKAEK